MDEYYSSKRTRPESQIVQVGTKALSIPVSELQEIVKEQIEWETKTFPQAVIRDDLRAQQKTRLRAAGASGDEM